jgi:vancomycin resistance protein VanW
LFCFSHRQATLRTGGLQAACQPAEPAALLLSSCKARPAGLLLFCFCGNFQNRVGCKMRKLFCEYGAAAFWISTQKCRFIRNIKNLLSLRNVARQKSAEPLPELVMKYETVLFRDSALFDPLMEQNKKINISIACPKITDVLIKPGETLSVCKLMGNQTKRKGYKVARVLKCNKPAREIGGGLCQLSNMIHYLALHTPLTITERHNHDWADLYPDFGKQIPFGTGASVLYNYIDLRIKNNTSLTYQIVLSVKDNHLFGELRSNLPQTEKFLLETVDFCFTREEGNVFRNGRVLRHSVNPEGEFLHTDELVSYHAKVLYDTNVLDEIIDKTEDSQ